MNKDQKAANGGSTKKSGLKAAKVASKKLAIATSAVGKKVARVHARPRAAIREAPKPVCAEFGPLRAELHFTRAQFSRLLGFSERAVAEWESGSRTPTEPAVRSHRELERLIKALRRVMQPAYVRTWLMSPSEAFDGLKPVEVIERGESDRIWRMVYELESGSPL